MDPEYFRCCQQGGNLPDQTPKRRICMKKQVGLWIDHKRAVIITLKDGKEEIKKITSNMEKHVRFTSEDGRGEDTRDRQFENHLNDYYDDVIAFIRDADSILVFGPGEAK